MAWLENNESTWEGAQVAAATAPTYPMDSRLALNTIVPAKMRDADRFNKFRMILGGLFEALIFLLGVFLDPFNFLLDDVFDVSGIEIF